MAKLKSEVTISLKDLFSSAMSKAAGAAGGFADKTLGAFDKVDKVVSGAGARLAALGVTLSVGAAAKSVMELDHRMTRLGISAGASAVEVAKLKRLIFDTAQAPDIKIDTDNLLNAIDTVVNKTNDLKYAEDNIKNIAYAIQATGESGEAIGNIFSEFQKFGYSTEQIISLMDDLAAQANEGSFSLADFAKQAPAIFSSYSKIGTAPENIKKVNAALQILNAGMKSPEKAASSLYAAMNELGDIETQKKLKRVGIDVLNKDTKEFRDFNDIMFDIAAKTENARDMNYLNSFFSNSTLQAIRSYVSHGERMYENLSNLGDTTGLLQKQSSAMADTLQSNIKNLQTAFKAFADNNLAEPLAKITDIINKLSEDPDRLKRVFTGIALGIGAITAVKGIAGITRFIGSLTRLQSGNINLGSLSMAAAMPVYVTNWGGGIPSGGASLPGSSGVPAAAPSMPGGTIITRQNAANFKNGAKKAGAAMVVYTGVTQTANAVREVNAISADTEMTDKEKSKAKGGVVGEAVGTTIGTAGGVLAGALLAGKIGAAIGTAVAPGIGTAIGGAIGLAGGALVGWLGGKAGRKIGEGIGEAVAKDDQNTNQYSIPARDLPAQITQAGTNIAQQEFDLGHADINLKIDLTGDRPSVTTVIQNNTMPARFNTGVRNRLAGNTL